MSVVRHVRKVALGVIGVWLMILVYMLTHLIPSERQTSTESLSANDDTVQRLSRAAQELNTLKEQNDELRQLINTIRESQNKNCPSRIENVKVPSKEFEVERRRAENNVKELWYYVNSQLRLLEDGASGQKHVRQVRDNVAVMKRVVLNNMYTLSNLDGMGEWREMEHKNLSSLIQQRIHYLQNPSNCATARKLVCNINKGCGYGCQIHHAIYCFLVAYGSQRTLILESRGWRYSSQGWEGVFKPLSDSCTSAAGTKAAWGKRNSNVQVVELPIVDSVHPKPPYLPLSVPSELSSRLVALHGDPAVWWVGQFLAYLLRYQDAMKREIEVVRKKMAFMSPVVGVHVRRTDKVGTEAAFHPLEEYMSHVDDYYDTLDWRNLSSKSSTNIKRRVYIATDDPTLLVEAKEKYRGSYEILGDVDIAKSAGLSSRYSDASLRGIIMDIHFLSLTDYLVCTFSSQVCRLAYEMMNSLHPDASRSFRSLDDIYYFGGQNAHNRRVIFPHEAENGGEIDLSVGDLVGVAGNHWDGYSKGTNKRTGRTGLYPSYKVEDVVDEVDFPAYPPIR